jgi:hypothetical protein
MKLEEIKEIAKSAGLTTRNAKKADIIRSIQRNEGNDDCYNTGYANECGQLSCLWREDCK